MSKQSWRGSTLLNPEPPVLVSCGGLEQPNLITIGWTGTICTQPSMVSISVRPERYSHHLIKESGQFAINLPTEQLVRAVDWCGVKSGRDNDKFAACKLHAAPGSVLTDCPILEESPVNLECRVTQVIPLGSHDLFLAEVVACDVDESLLDENGKLPKIRSALFADAVGTTLGAALGTSTITTFVESSSGIAEGGRTGLTSVTAGILFLVSLFLSPVFLAIPSFATAPALIVVGFLMMQQVVKIQWDNLTEAIPAFIAVIAMPFMYSISEGISMGVISYVVINLVTGHAKEKKISTLMYVLAVLFVLKYILI